MKIIFTMGVPGSGKSTWAKKYLKTNSEFVRINADELRQMLFGFEESEIMNYYNDSNLKNNEDLVWKTIDSLAESLIYQGKSIILDNTNLNLSVIENYKIYEVPLLFKVMDTTLDECLKRNKERSRVVPEDYIKKQYKIFLNLIKNLNKDDLI
jgi:predicted kinase